MVKNLSTSAGDVRVWSHLGLTPGSGRLIGEGNSNPLQYSCLKNPMDRGAWWVTVHGTAKHWTRLNTYACPISARKPQWLLPHSLKDLRKLIPGDSDSKESACNVGYLGSIPGLGIFPEEGTGYPHHYSWLENSKDRGAWQATIHGIAKSQTWLSDFHSTQHWRWKSSHYNISFLTEFLINFYQTCYFFYKYTISASARYIYIYMHIYKHLYIYIINTIITLQMMKIEIQNC